MKKFSFRLQTVLDLRIKEEEELLRSLAEKEQELERAKSGLTHKEEALKAFQTSQKEMRSSQTVVELRNSVSWRHHLKMELLQVARQIQEIQFDIQIARTKLIKATQKRKALEILYDKQYKKWKDEFNRREQIFLDELAQNKFFRNR